MKFIMQMFSDVDGQGSQKRLVVFGVFLVVAAIAIGVTFFHATLNESVWTDLIFLLGAGLGLITSEKFTKRGIRNDQTPDQPSH
jgi:hypothetical protein